jgi:hypothetical protein
MEETRMSQAEIQEMLNHLKSIAESLSYFADMHRAVDEKLQAMQANYEARSTAMHQAVNQQWEDFISKQLWEDTKR